MALRKGRGIRLLLRNCYRSLAILAALLPVVGLAVAAAPARAATSASSSALSRALQAAAAAEGVKAATATVAASGDLTIDVDPGIAYDAATMQALITKVQGLSPHLSDTFLRMFEAGMVTPPSGTSAAYNPQNGWQTFDGTLAMDSDDSGISVTIPAAEVQASATWGQEIAAAIIGAIANLLVRVVCVGGLTFIFGPGVLWLEALCAVAANVIGNLARYGMISALTHTTPSGGDWAQLIAATFILAVPAGIWELGVNSWTRTTLVQWLRSFGTRTLPNAAALSPYDATASADLSSFGTFLNAVADALPAALDANSSPSGPSGPTCDIYLFYETPCASAYSTTRALYSAYDGPLYQVQRASDNTTTDIGLLAAGGYVNAAAQDSFCASTTCTITRVYDQSQNWNDLTVEGAGGAAGADGPADATALPVTVAGHEAYGIDFTGDIGYRDNSTTGIATNGAPEGMYMVASGTNVNSGCCFDFGNAETNTRDNGAGHMDAVNLTTWCGSNVAPCAGTGPWVEADMENGQWTGNGSNPANTGVSGDFVTAMLKNNGQDTFALSGGNSQSGGLTKYWDGSLPNGYKPMAQEGAVVLGTGGDNSNSGIGSFFEGVMTSGFPTDAADAAVQANIVSAGYSGNAGGNGGEANGVMPSAAGPAVVHSAGATGAGSSGFSSVYTVNSANGHLQETYLPYMGDNWSTQDLSANYGTPPVMPGTQPVALVHCGFTSVYTVDAASGDLQETYLPAIGDAWSTQDLSANYGTPPTDETPTAVMHAAGASGATASCGFASVYTVDRNGDLQETYLPNAGFPGDPWNTQDLSANYGTPKVQPGTAPVAIVHCGFSSVYTVDGGSHDLQETYLPAIGDSWSSQDLSVNYGTPKTDTTPTAVVHSAGASGATAGCGYTSVYTVDQGSRHLDETYLPNAGFPGDPWHSQDLSANYGTPAVAPGTAPAALVHMNFTSVYTVDQGSNQLQETYLPAIGDRWNTQSLSANYGTPTTDQTPIVLLHPDASGNLDWASVFTINEFSNDLQETYLPNTGFPGDPWVTQDLSAKYGTPTVTVQQSSQSSWSVDHAGYTSAYTVDNGSGDLQETYLPAMGDNWSTQDLTKNYGTPTVTANAAPSALVHDGFTSVYTVDSGSRDLQETYLQAIGDSWNTQNLSTGYGTPAVAANTSPTSLFHDGYASVYTVDANGDLQETYLPGAGFPGDPWHSQDLSVNYGTPKVMAGTSPVSILHDGYASVYTVDANGDLQETYLAVMGGSWATQDLTVKYGTPQTTTTPTAVFHDGYTSVYTVDKSGDLQETYLPAIADNWATQDLTTNYGVPTAKQGPTTNSVNPMAPVALYHTGYTSVYYLNGSSSDLEEAYLPDISGPWHSQDLSVNYGTPAPTQTPSPLVHYAANGGETWTSIYTVDNSSLDLQETYLPAIGNNWTTQDLTTKYGTPPV